MAFALLGASVAMPMLVGLLAVDLTADLGLDERRLGVAIAAFWLVTAVGAPLGGRWVDRRGWESGVALGVVLCAAGLLGAVALVHSWAGLVVVLALSGLAYALCSPTSNLLVVALVPRRRRASTLALKQTAPPLITAGAGATLPALATWQGWRAALAVGLVLPLAAGLGARLLATRGARQMPVGRLDRPPHGLDALPGGPDVGTESGEGVSSPVLRAWPLVVAAGLGTLSVATVTGFSVLTLVAAGLAPVVAAGVVSGGSLLAVAARLGSGRFLDRRAEDDLVPLVVMMLAATAALALVGAGLLLGHGGGRVSAGAVVVGVVASLVTAWTWPALLLLVVVRTARDAGTASGTLQLGSGLGSAVGPLVFGVLSAAGGRGWAWLLMALCTAVALALLRLARRPAMAADEEVAVVPRAGDRCH